MVWRKVMVRRITLIALIISSCSISGFSFCGFYVAKGDTKLFNRASQVVLVRDGDHTVMTLANDFRGSARDFAMVVPVPTKIERGQIHVAEKGLIDHIDAYSSPRLVEYFDPDPCAMRYPSAAAQFGGVLMDSVAVRKESNRAKSLGVTIEARYTVGEYDILILSAQQSDGLETWLRENGYTIPPGASSVLGSYIRQKMKFFVARVNLSEKARLGVSYLRPLQVAYESPKFMLPIRLGTVNADGPQELLVYALTRSGRVETTNYRTVRLPSDVDVPLFVRDDFAPFYKALFSQQVQHEDMSAVFLEYAWDMNWCDPCAAEPLSRDELRKLGVYWLASEDQSGASNVFLSRLHVRYDRAHFPEDLVFQETGDRRNFQARYVLHHPWGGSAECEATQQYRRELHDRREREAKNMTTLTGWDPDDVRKRMHLVASEAPEGDRKWWSVW